MISQEDLVTVLKIARVGLAMNFDEISEELGLPDAELNRIRNDLINTLEGEVI